MALGSAARQSVIIEADFQDKASSGLKNLSGNINNTLGDTGPNSLGKIAGKARLGVAAIGAAFAAVGVAAVAGIGKSIGVAADFQQAMADVGAITRANAEDLAKLEEKAKEMGRTTSFSASQSAEAIQFLGMAGFDTNEIMTALPATLNLAAAGGLELGAAADIASNVLSGMRLETEDLGKVVDGMAITAASANTSVSQLGQAMSFAAPGAAAAGVSFGETSAALGILADNGIQATRGGTNFNAMLRVMQNQSEGNKEKLAALGIEFLDTAGNLKPLHENIEAIEKAGLSSADMITFFGDEGSRAINAMVGSGVERLRALTTEIENAGGAAEEMAKKKLATFEGAWKLTKSALEGLMIAVGQRFLPLMQNMLNNYITPAIAAFGEWMDKLGGLGEMFGAMLTLVTEFGQSIWNTINNIFSDQSFRDNFIKSFTDGFIRVFSSVAQLAVTWLDGLFGADGIFALAMKTAWEPLKFAFSLIWEPIKVIAIAGWNAVQKVIVDGANYLIDQINALGDYFGFTINRIDFTALTVDMPASVEARWTTMKDKTAKNFDALGERADQLGTDMTTAFGNTADAVVKTYEEVVQPNLTAEFKETVTSIKNNFDEPVKKEVKKTADDIVTKMDDAGEKVATNAKTHGENTGTNFKGGLKNQLFDPASGVGAVFTDTFTGINNDSSFGDIISNLGTSISNRLGESLGPGIASALGTAFGVAESAIAEGRWTAEHTGTAIGGGIGAGIGFKLGGPQGAVLGAKVGSLIGGKIGGMFRGDDDPSDEKKLAANMIEAATSRGGVGNTKDFSLQGITGRDFRKVLRDLGFGRDAAQKIWEKVERRAIYGKQGQEINDIIFDWAVSSSVEKHQMSEQGLKWSERVGEAAQERLGIDPSGPKDNNWMFPLVEEEPEVLSDDWIKKNTASGFSGMVNSPTLFMAGEAGPEMVNVTPRGASLQGGGWGGGRSTLNFNFNISAIDARGVRQFVEEDARDVIVEMLQKESFRSANVVYQSGVTTDPSV